jgi:hypothetical protein
MLPGTWSHAGQHKQELGTEEYLLVAKNRSGISRDVAAEVLFESDRTCCVCRERGKPVQIHHIDKNPSNHDPENLAVLCLDCHNQTQLKGGFGRKLDAQQVVRYRHDWRNRVARRRDLADDLASARAVGLSLRTFAETASDASPSQGPIEPGTRSSDLFKYINALPAIRHEAVAKARPLWDGTTASMMQGCYDVIDVLEQILTHLASWYPGRHFGDKDAKDYMNAMTASRFEWHGAHLEPEGPGTSGTIIGPMAANSVMSDLEGMVVEMVRSLTMDEDAFDFASWAKDWQR